MRARHIFALGALAVCGYGVGATAAMTSISHASPTGFHTILQGFAAAGIHVRAVALLALIIASGGCNAPVEETRSCTTASGCGLALGCVMQGCHPCWINEHCSPQELCFSGLCVLREATTCLVDDECPPDFVCRASSLGEGPRNNIGTTVSCHPTFGDTDNSESPR